MATQSGHQTRHQSLLTDKLQAHLAALVATSDDAIISKTTDGKIVYWNHGAERIYGYTSDEALGQSINMLAQHGEDEHADIVKRFQHGQRLEHYETKRMRKDGRVIDVALTVSPIERSEGELIGFSTIARALSAQSVAERETAEKEQKLCRLAELERFLQPTVGRERKMIEHKPELNIKEDIARIAVASLLLARQGGRIRADGRPGRGARVRIDLPEGGPQAR